MPKHTIELGPTGQRLVALVVLLGATVAAGWFLAGANRRVTLAEAVPSMVETTARILAVEARTAGRSGRRGPVSYRIDVDYEYEVAGTSHRSSSAWISPPRFTSRTDAETAAQTLGLTPAAILPAFYNQGEPQQSLLYRDLDPAKAEWDRTERLICVVLVSLFALGAASATIAAIRSMRA